MDYKYIEQLLDRYFQCETSLEEERILRTFFSQKDVPVALLPYRDLFVYQQSETMEDQLSADFDQRILSIIGEVRHLMSRHASSVCRHASSLSIRLWHALPSFSRSVSLHKCLTDRLNCRDRKSVV